MPKARIPHACVTFYGAGTATVIAHRCSRAASAHPYDNSALPLARREAVANVADPAGFAAWMSDAPDCQHSVVPIASAAG